MSDARGPLRDHFSIALVLFASAFFWLVSFPYLGVMHDAVVYALLVARELDPAAYANELFFVFGSQDDFSIFTPLFARLVSAFGLDLAARIVVLTGGALWVMACFTLCRAATQRHWLGYFACFVLASTTLNYSPNQQTFNVYEHFATARSLAFPLTVLALAAAVSSRNLLAWALSLTATLLHPLLGIWALVLWFCLRVNDRWTALAVVLGFVGVLSGPLWSTGGGLQLMDAEWVETIQASSGDVFLGGWGQFRLLPILFWLGLLWLGGRHGNTPMRRWYLAMALVCSWAILLSLICSLYWPVRLVIQAQPWRALWLAEVLAVVALADLLRAALVYRRSLFWLAIGSGLVLWAFDGWLLPWPFVIVAGAALPTVRAGALRALDWLEMHRKQSIAGALVLVSVMLPGYLVSLEIAGDSVPAVWGSDFDALRGFFLRGGEGILFLVLAWLLGRARWSLLVALLIIPATAIAAMRWDIRTPASRERESRYLAAVQDPGWVGDLRFAGVRPGDVVAWPRQDRAVWFTLRTAYYGGPGESSSSVTQAIGMVFSRERTIEVRRRLARIALASRLTAPHGRHSLAFSPEHGIPANTNLHTLVRDPPTEIGVKFLCADPILAWVVAPYSTVGGVGGTPFDPGQTFGGRQYLYRCRDLV